MSGGALSGWWLTDKPVLPHLQRKDGIKKDRGLAEILPWEHSQPPLLGLSEQQTDAPVLTPGLTVCPGPGRGNSSTIAKINPWEKAVQSSELREVGK